LIVDKYVGCLDPQFSSPRGNAWEAPKHTVMYSTLPHLGFANPLDTKDRSHRSDFATIAVTSGGIHHLQQSTDGRLDRGRHTSAPRTSADAD
jgi:hypothetical protein